MSTFQKRKNIKRRDFIAGIASVPLLGTRGDFPVNNSAEPEPETAVDGHDLIRLGIIGYGARGKALVEAATRDLNIDIRGVCEVFDARLKHAKITRSDSYLLLVQFLILSSQRIVM